MSVNYQELVKQITPELYATFKRSLERGHWPDGREMTQEQREHCLQAIIAYDALHTPEQDRVGYIEKSACASTEQALRWTESGPDKDTN